MRINFRCIKLNYKRLLVIILLYVAFFTEVSAQKLITGWLEEVTINNSIIPIQAKVDSGADHSSINSYNPVIFTKQGKQWVKFSIKNKAGHNVVIHQPIIKNTRIKMKNGDSQKRIVIMLDLCLGSIKKQVKVNLADRRHF